MMEKYSKLLVCFVALGQVNGVNEAQDDVLQKNTITASIG